MSTARDLRQVVVIGGGVIGCSIAWRLAQRGLAVTVVERDVPGRAATWAAAGMLSPLGETRHHPDFLDLGHRSMQLYPAFLADVQDASGMEVEHGFPGKIETAYDDVELQHFRRAFDGQPVRFLSSADVQRLEPDTRPDLGGGVWFEGDGFVDNRRLGEALWQAGLRAGVQFRSGEFVTGVAVAANQVSAVTTATDELRCDAVVVAAGAWSAQLHGLPRALPVFPVRGQMLSLHAPGTNLQHMLQSTDCYLIPRSGERILVGATVEQVGFDPRTTATGIKTLLAAATQLVPKLGAASIQEMWSGFRPCTPDELPVLGADPDVRGLFYATGHYRNGILLTPITADLISAHITGATPSVALHTFRIDRFANDRAQAAQS